MTKQRRTVFYLSDRTGITAETLGHSLLTQFDGIDWEIINVPFLDDLEKARLVLVQINHAIERDGQRPLVFSTLLQPEILEIIKQANCRVFDFFETFINPIEVELNQPFARMAGRSHGLQHHWSYFKRIAAINYVLAHDDGVNPKNFAEADIILIGVSRSGKTPTCLYLGLQYGIAAANYPLTEEDMTTMQLPEVLENVKSKLFGLTLSVAQLHFIRQLDKLVANGFITLQPPGNEAPIAGVTTYGPCQVTPQSVERCTPIVCTVLDAPNRATMIDA